MSEDDIRTMSIDLRSFMQRHPSVVHGDARLSRAYRQFRTMGLRHMYAPMPSRPRVVGLLTRKDVIQERASLTRSLRARTRPSARENRLADVRTSRRRARRRRRRARRRLPEPTSRTATVEDDDAKNDLPYIPYYSNNAQDDEDAGVHTIIPRRRRDRRLLVGARARRRRPVP